MNKDLTECDGVKAIVMMSMPRGIITIPPLKPINQTSYRLFKKYLETKFKANPLFLTEKPAPWTLTEYKKEYLDGNRGTEFILNQSIDSTLIRENNSVKSSKIGAMGFDNDFEQFATEEDDNLFSELLCLMFVDTSKRIKSVSEEIWDSVKAHYDPTIADLPIDRERLKRIHKTILLNDGLDYSLFKNNVNTKDIECFKRWNTGPQERICILNNFSKSFKLPELELKEFNSEFDLPANYYKFHYQGENYWESESGIDTFDEDLGIPEEINEEILLFPSLRDFFAWEYLGIKNRKRCLRCKTLLPKDYKGSYCSSEFNPECRKRYESERKKH